MSPAVVEVIEAIDKERIAISREFGFNSPPVLTIMNQYYGQKYATFAEFARKSAEHNMTKMAPTHMKDRFITQDVPFVLVPWFELGLKVGVYSSALRSLIDMASIVNGTDYLETGRNLRTLGLESASRNQILGVVNATAPSDADRGGHTPPRAEAVRRIHGHN
jgi:opine dehydrogenase